MTTNESSISKPQLDTSPYRQLEAAEIIQTAHTLSSRVSERFPTSKLARVAIALHEESRAAEQTARRLAAPMIFVRIASYFLIVALIALVAMTLGFLRGGYLWFTSIADLLQGLDAAVNEVILFGIAAFFLLGVETRLKRRRALKALHTLRSLAHIIDLHQMTKDPTREAGSGPDTASSPPRPLTPFETTRYLDYCSEMLSIVGKIAALYVQNFRDPVTLSAVDEIQDLTVGLSHKIWQKIMIQGCKPT